MITSERVNEEVSKQTLTDNDDDDGSSVTKGSW